MKARSPEQLLRSVWHAVKARCHNPTHASYRYYGARGIHLWPAWHDFQRFMADVGPRPAGLELDRIDNNRGYEPGNVRWATRKQQMNNRRNNFCVGRETLTSLSERCGVNVYTLRGRLLRGESVETATRQPRAYKEPTRLSAEELFEAYQMRFRGCSVRAIARAFGCDHGNLSRVLSGGSRGL